MKRKMKPLVYSTISALVISMCSGTAAFAGEYNYTDTSMAVADVIGSLNIREYASEDSQIVGTLFAGSGAEVIGTYGDWSLICSGDVTGYVKTQFLAFGESANALANVYGVPGNLMEANYTGAPVYAKADIYSTVLGTACEGQQLEVISNDGVFAKISLYDGSTGYMALDDLSYVPILDTAVANENYVPQTYTDYSDVTYDVQDEYYGETYYDDVYIPETPEYETEAPMYETDYVPQTYTDYSDVTYDVQDEYYGETYYDDVYIPETPEYETEAPMYETDAPVYETEAPMYETEAPEYETEAPMYETETPEYETEAPEYETETPETEPSIEVSSDDLNLLAAIIYETEAPMYETETPEYETEAPEYETETPETEPSIEVSSDDLNLLAAIIYCEAGNQSREGKVAVGAVVMNRVASSLFPNTIYDVIYQSGQFTPAYSGALANAQSREGKVAVGAVVMNRVASSLFPNTIYDVIYQSGQFTPAYSGALANALANGVPDDCVEAAQAALNGENPVGGALYFNTGSGQGIQIGDHQFY